MLLFGLAACESGGSGTHAGQIVVVQPTPAATASPAPAPTPRPAPAGLRSVSASIADVPSWARFQNVADYVGHDPRYALKTAWGECLTLSARQSPSIAARCEIRSFRLVEFHSRHPDSGDAGSVVGDAEFARHSPAEGQAIRCDLVPATPGNYRLPPDAYCVGANFSRASCPPGGGACTPSYYADGDPADGNAGSFFPGDNMRVSGGILAIDASAHPTLVSHWWTVSPDPPFARQQDWRAVSSPGMEYLVEIEFRTIGDAALRVGLDRWTAHGEAYAGECSWAGTAGTHSNCEDYATDWFQTESSGWFRVRLPLF